MREEIKIIFQYYLPNDIIQGFKNLELDTKTNLKFQLEIEEESEWLNFSGNEMFDIVVVLQLHALKIITDGLFWDGLKFLWNSLLKIPINKLEEKGKNDDTPKSISLKLINKEKIAEIVFEGGIQEGEMDKIIKKAIDFVNSEKLETAFKTPDNWPNINEANNIRLIYNNEKNIWEFFNYGDCRREIEQLMKFADENLSD